MAASADKLALREALARLPRQQRTVVVLRFYGGMTVPETATAMSVSDGSVKTHLHRGMATLRRQLEPAAPHESIGDRSPCALITTWSSVCRRPPPDAGPPTRCGRAVVHVAAPAVAAGRGGGPVGALTAGVAGAVDLRPAVELAPGASADGPAAGAFAAAAYCTEAASFLDTVVDSGEEPGAADAAFPDGFDFRASHDTMTEQFARAAALAPPELADAWAAVQADHAAQRQVWEAIGWDPEQAGGWPALAQQLTSLPTAAAGSNAVTALAADYASRCPAD